MKIALLATGDELTNGDILNTNGQTIAQTLFDAGFQIGQHVIVADVEAEIIDSIQYLKKSHEVIIITGGLGPTSDDRTRFALAKANNLELYFDEPSWQAIIDRLNRYALKIHDSNKQQAYFPVGSVILPNVNGTAAGCQLQVDNTLFFMLPGPPKECLPMFQEFVLPYLLENSSGNKYQQNKWRLFGVSEGEIAAELDHIARDFPVTTGYRWDYPYLEFKLRYETDSEIEALIQQIETRIEPHCICTATQTASELLIQQLKSIAKPLIIHDQATHGWLQQRLTQPEIFDKIQFTSTDEAHIHITGLTELWQGKAPQGQIELRIKGTYGKQTIDETCKIPFRNRRVLEYAVEFIASKLAKLLAS